MAQQLKTDRILFYAIVVMVFFGLVIVYSASSVMAELKYQSTYYFIVRQLGWAALSVFVLMYLKRTDYRQLDRQGRISVHGSRHGRHHGTAHNELYSDTCSVQFEDHRQHCTGRLQLQIQLGTVATKSPTARLFAF